MHEREELCKGQFTPHACTLCSFTVSLAQHKLYLSIAEHIFFFPLARQPCDARQEAESVPESLSPRGSISSHSAEQNDPQCVLCISDSAGGETELLETFPNSGDSVNAPGA